MSNKNESKESSKLDTETEKKERLAALIEEHWNSLGFGGKCASVLCGALNSVVSVPVNLFDGAVETVKDVGGSLVDTLKTIPDNIAESYNVGLRAVAETGGLHPGSRSWDEEYKKLGWVRRGLAFLAGCLTAAVGVPIHLVKGVVRAGTKLVGRVVSLPFAILANSISSYNTGSLSVMYRMAKPEETAEFIVELNKTQNEKARMIIGASQDGLDSLKKDLLSFVTKEAHKEAAAAAAA